MEKIEFPESENSTEFGSKINRETKDLIDNAGSGKGWRARDPDRRSRLARACPRCAGGGPRPIWRRPVAGPGQRGPSRPRPAGRGIMRCDG